MLPYLHAVRYSACVIAFTSARMHAPSRVNALHSWRGLFALVVACGGSDGAQRADGSAPSAEDGSASFPMDDGSLPRSGESAFLNDYAAAVCALYEPCCEAGGLGYVASGCTAWYREIVGAFFRLRGEYHAERAGGCLAALDEVRRAEPERCREVPSFAEATLRSRCSEAYVTPEREGKALGEACRLAGECAGSGEGTVLCYGGRCILERRGEEDDGPCIMRRSDEEPLTEIYRCDAPGGLYCHPSENKCTARVSVGELCPAPDACIDGAVCSRGRCAQLPGLDEPCLDAVPGSGGFCRAGSACDVSTLICGAPLAEGETCRESGQCASRSCGCAPPSCLRNICAKADFTQHLSCTGD